METYNNMRMSEVIDAKDVMGGALDPRTFSELVAEFMEKYAEGYKGAYAYYKENGELKKAEAILNRVYNLLGDYLEIRFIFCGTRLSRKACEFLVNYVRNPRIEELKVCESFDERDEKRGESVGKILAYIDYVEGCWINLFRNLICN